MCSQFRVKRKEEEEASRAVEDKLYPERTDSLTQEAMHQLHDSGNRSRLPMPPARHVIQQGTLISGAQRKAWCTCKHKRQQRPPIDASTENKHKFTFSSRVSPNLDSLSQTFVP
jgi:hypothetical protein